MEITVPVQIDEKMFLRFACFDTFVMKKRWKGPACFSAILLLSALICLSQPTRSGAVLLGSVLLVISVLVPGSYFLSYFLSVKRQARRIGLARITPVYNLTLNDSHIHVEYAGQKSKPENYNWDRVFAVCFRKKAVYLYVTAQKAFILPAWQIEPDCDALRSLCAQRLDETKLR